VQTTSEAIVKTNQFTFYAGASKAQQAKSQQKQDRSTSDESGTLFKHLCFIDNYFIVMNE